MDCRLCLAGDSDVYIKMDTHDYLKQLELVMPEIDLNLTRSPHICGSCSVLLSTAYTFKLNCLRTEEELKASVNDVRDESKRKYENAIGGQQENVDDWDDSSADQTMDNSEESVGSVKEELTVKCEETQVVESDPIPFEEPPKRAHAEETFLCKFCGLTIDTYQNWFEHIKVHSGTNNNCNICLKSFESRAQLLAHKQTHRINKCDVCGQEFVYKSTFARHMRERHQSKRQPAKGGAAGGGQRGAAGRCECGVCGLRLIDKSSLVAHTRRHTGERPFQCRECPKAFAQNSTLTTHVRMVHLPDRPFHCEACGKAFAVRSLYNLHLKLKHSDAPKEHVCDRCGKAFARRCHLNGHARSHSRVKTAVCQVCKKTLASKRELRRHVRTHTSELPFACGICERRFGKQYHMRLHAESCARRSRGPKPDAE